MSMVGILVFAAVSTGNPAEEPDPNRSIIAPTFVKTPPVLDGKMAEGEWDQITMTTGFRYTDLSLATAQTEIWSAFD